MCEYRQPAHRRGGSVSALAEEFPDQIAQLTAALSRLDPPDWTTITTIRARVGTALPATAP